MTFRRKDARNVSVDIAAGSGCSHAARISHDEPTSSSSFNGSEVGALVPKLQTGKTAKGADDRHVTSRPSPASPMSTAPPSTATGLTRTCASNSRTGSNNSKNRQSPDPKTAQIARLKSYADRLKERLAQANSTNRGRPRYLTTKPRDERVDAGDVISYMCGVGRELGP